METSQIDELLLRYSHAEDRIAANLVELDDHPTYGLMTSGVLTGSTADRVDRLVAKAPRLWAGLDALRRTLDRARGIRGNGRLNDHQQIELEAILTRESVLLDVAETPLGERDLLGDGAIEHRVSIEGLIDADLIATATHRAAQAARDVKIAREQHHARRRAPPEDGLTGAVPGEDAMPVGMQHALLRQVAADREQAVGVGLGESGRLR